MTELRSPVKHALRNTTTRASVARMWSRIEARGRTQRRKSVLQAWPLAATLIVVGSLAFAKTWPRARHASAPAPTNAASTSSSVTTRKAAPAIHPQVAPEPTSEAISSPVSTMNRGPTPPPATPSEAVASETWRQFAARGENQKAYAELGQGGIALEAQSASVTDLFALADVARLSGHPKEAVGPLERILAQQSTDARAPLAALTLGRVQLRSLSAPAAAAQSLQQALALGVPAGLAEDAYALLVESCSRSGSSEATRSAYSRYIARFPESPRAPELRKWLRDP
jgi:transmembrane sensor